jgi:hypothetical protein
MMQIHAYPLRGGLLRDLPIDPISAIAGGVLLVTENLHSCRRIQPDKFQLASGARELPADMLSKM